MTAYIFIIISFVSSVVGAICGIGGGIFIKPLLDAFGNISTEMINFLSGCTVLSMATYSVMQNRLVSLSQLRPQIITGLTAQASGNRTGNDYVITAGGIDTKANGIETKIALPLAIGAAVGGIGGKWLFSCLSFFFPEQNEIRSIQAICLLAVTVATLLYTLFKDRIPTHQIDHPVACGSIGLFLGLISSFLGIGGGPLNLVVLFFFFSLTTKSAALYSLYIIFFSQLTNLLVAIITKSVPPIQFSLLALMVIGGLVGGIAGRALYKKFSEATIHKLFIIMMVVIISVNIYNIYS
ncbi:MAG: sulfite exporter TauE/SafE family protein [Lachnospiraceae bacterium]|jgi:uncharacterized membrane protein YfcA|nr:sulfite exporter TauE/SafE family protein [Lachnospiraceae bacterium]